MITMKYNDIDISMEDAIKELKREVIYLTENGNITKEVLSLEKAIFIMNKYNKILEILNNSSYIENGKEYSYTYDNDSRIKHIMEVVQSKELEVLKDENDDTKC